MVLGFPNRTIDDYVHTLRLDDRNHLSVDQKIVVSGGSNVDSASAC